ncbi:MAG: recombinase family protein [Clostridiales bacterium]|nr:recombinase family protein [Clostridiales bacterium]
MNAIYTRQSLDIKDSLSIETQLAACLAENADAPYRHYNDKGFSGKDTKRPAFHTMMQDVASGRVEKVIVYRLDRLSRSILDFAEMIEVFRKNGVEFVSCREKFDTAAPIGNAMLNIIMVFAQLERETIQLRMRDNYAVRMEHGAYDALAPYGYRKTAVAVSGKTFHTIEPDAKTAETVRQVFSAYAYGGVSLGALAKRLNRSGTPSPKGAAWDGGKLSRIISNPIYVCASPKVYSHYRERSMKITSPVEAFGQGRGLITYGGWERNRRKFSQPEKLTLSVGLHEGIIDADTFLLCQQRLLENSQLKNTGKGKHSFLTGLVKCGYCGHALKVQCGKTKRFVCSGETNYGVCGSFCGISVDLLEGAVEKELHRAVKSRERLAARPVIQPDREEHGLLVRAAKCREQLERLADAFTDGRETIPETLFRRMRLLEAELTETERALCTSGESRETESDVLQFRDISRLWAAMQLHEKREFARLLIRRIDVKNGCAEIKWHYDFS